MEWVQIDSVLLQQETIERTTDMQNTRLDAGRYTYGYFPFTEVKQKGKIE